MNALAEKRWGVVTSNYAHRVQMRFERTGLPLPAVIVDADAVARGKPHPEGYLAAADALGVHPRDCLVIEDGLTGVEAARRAGMTVWAVNVPAISAAAESADSHYPTIDSERARILQWLDGSLPL